MLKCKKSRQLTWLLAAAKPHEKIVKNDNILKKIVKFSG